MINNSDNMANFNNITRLRNSREHGRVRYGHSK